MLLGVGAVFTYTWYTAYKGLIADPFFRKGNWLLILIYVLLFLVFSRIYGGFRVGYQKRSEIIYSNMLELLFTNVVTYFQISLIARKLLPPFPMVLMTLGDVVLICIWSFLSSALYTKLYPPREVLLVYGSDLAYSSMEAFFPQGPVSGEARYIHWPRRAGGGKYHSETFLRHPVRYSGER